MKMPAHPHRVLATPAAEFIAAAPVPDWSNLTHRSTPEETVSLECQEVGPGLGGIDRVSLSSRGRVCTRLGHWRLGPDGVGLPALRFALKNIEVAWGVDALPPVLVRVLNGRAGSEWMTPDDYEDFDKEGRLLRLIATVAVAACAGLVLLGIGAVWWGTPR